MSEFRAATCDGKERMTWKIAKKAARNMRSKGSRVAIYHCSICHTWHVGSPDYVKGMDNGKRRAFLEAVAKGEA